MKKIIQCFKLLFIFIIFNASAMEERENHQNTTRQELINAIPDLQILALQAAQNLSMQEQEQQLELLKQKNLSLDVDYYRFLMQLPQKDDLCVSEVHLRSFMAYCSKNKDYFDPNKISFDKVFDQFFSVYATDGFENPNRLFNNLEPIKNLTKKILDEERNHKNSFVFYHAMHMHKAFLMDILTELRKQLMSKNIINYGIIWNKNQHTFPENLQKHIDEQTSAAIQQLQKDLDNYARLHSQNKQHDAHNIVHQFLNGKNLLHLNEEHRDLLFYYLREKFRLRFHSEFMLATNFALFANNGFNLEYTFRFWIENISCIHSYKNGQHQEPTIEQLKSLLRSSLIPIFEELNIPDNHLLTLVNDFYALFKEIFNNNQMPMGGRLLAIFINPNVVDKIAYIGNHIPLNIQYNNARLYHPCQFLPLYKKNPTLCEFLIRRYRGRIGKEQSTPPSSKIYSDKKAHLKISKKCLKRTSEYPDLGINNIFSAFFVDPNFVYNHENVEVKTYDLFFSDEQQKENYYAEINRLVSHYLSLACNENKNPGQLHEET